MKFVSALFERPVNLDLPLTADENAPQFGIFAACDQCGRLLGRRAATEAEAVGLALANGWSVRIGQAYKLDGVFTAENLTGAEAEVFCPHCAIEFEP
jgi:hypothetical protein